MNDQSLSGRVVWITGATGALGSVVARSFAETGARLVLTSTSADDLSLLVAELGRPTDHVLIAPADVTSAEEVQGALEAAIDHYGRVDILINTVGGWSGGNPVQETDLETWDVMMDLNLKSAFLLSRAVLPSMLEAGWGRILHISSKTGAQPQPKQAGYAASKRGLIALTEVIAAEVKGRGVTANTLLPSIIDTPANRKWMTKADPRKWVPPEQIAAALRFLCSEEASSINGASLPIYGAV